VVDLEDDLDLDLAAARLPETRELEGAEGLAFLGLRALALQHLDADLLLAVPAGGEDLRALGGDGGVLIQDDLGESPTVATRRGSGVTSRRTVPPSLPIREL